MSGRYLPVLPLIGHRFPKASVDENEMQSNSQINVFKTEEYLCTTKLKYIQPTTKNNNK